MEKLAGLIPIILVLAAGVFVWYRLAKKWAQKERDARTVKYRDE